MTSSAVVGSSAISSRGSHGERDGADHPLLHAAADLVGERAQALLRRRHAARGASSSTARARMLAAGRSARWARSASTIWLPTLNTGFSDVCGILEDHRDAAAAHLRHLALALRHEVLAVEEDLAAHDAARRLGEEPERRQRGHGLARAGLADEPERLALAHAKLTPSTACTTPQRVLRCALEVADLEDDVAGAAVTRALSR